MFNLKYMTNGNEEKLYNLLNNLTNNQGCFCSKSYVKFIHAVVGAPEVDIYIDGVLVVEG